jgi:hypothetical protein
MEMDCRTTEATDDTFTISLLKEREGTWNQQKDTCRSKAKEADIERATGRAVMASDLIEPRKSAKKKTH